MPQKVIDDAAIYKLYQQGYSHKEIALALCYGVSTVTRHLLDMGFKTYTVDKSEVKRLFEMGCTDLEISILLGCSRSNITIILNRMGYTNRKAKFDNIDLRDRISNSLIGKYTGKNSPVYKGYLDEKAVARGIFKTFSKRCIRHANYTCQHCGKHGGDLATHHIKPFAIIFEEFLNTVYDGNLSTLYNQLMNYPDFVDTSNFVVLCNECHWRVHYTDDHELSPYRWESATTIESTSQEETLENGSE